MKIPQLPDNKKKFTISPLGKIGFALGSVALGQWILTDFAHIPGGGIGLFALGAGAWWLTKPLKTAFDSPSSVNGWILRCKKVIDQFELLEEDNSSLKKEKRLNSVEKIINSSEIQSLAFIGSLGKELKYKNDFECFFESAKSLNIVWEPSLPLVDKTSCWPENLYKRDLLVYMLSLPLRASDLLWLEKIPEQQPTWIMTSSTEENSCLEELNELYNQLPDRWENRVLPFKEKTQDLSSLLAPLKKALEQPKKNRELTTQRLLSRLHTSWQAELEGLRREKFSDIQQKSQWIVAGVVFASPVPSTDLISIAVVNGLMIQEMASLWSCPWRPEVLQVVARQLVGAALAQGIVEWSGQALLGVAKIHGGTWLAAGALQSMSAAYLTRVVGRSMADWMALNNGVDECDLEALKIQAPKIVSKAAEEEKVDWGLFLKQASNWTKEIRILENVKNDTFQSA